ncbi:hypothetical protein DPEC_G00123310 [Dallia pectoralis]|uniref:Uncharacterized protein n=1 Tax=Dallia pectoralis TaxID=75939 RepID=A0ACC2GR75_DALPE|nr:hypothetical protein DPEC_G00123310 [Dallia pectoralis]
MLNSRKKCLFCSFVSVGTFVNGQQDDAKLNERPYVVLLNQNLAVLVPVFSVLLVVMIVLAVCVYKPVYRR